MDLRLVDSIHCNYVRLRIAPPVTSKDRKRVTTLVHSLGPRNIVSEE